MQVYASRHPDEVAGMVLVDSALEDEKAVALTQSHQPSPLVMKIYATISLTRLPYTLGGETSGLTSPALEDEQGAISSHRKHVFAVADGGSRWAECFTSRTASSPIRKEDAVPKELPCILRHDNTGEGTDIHEHRTGEHQECLTRQQVIEHSS
jgi:pimeloyl-ACP methyl ester carboxylesterase